MLIQYIQRISDRVKEGQPDLMLRISLTGNNHATGNQKSDHTQKHDHRIYSLLQSVVSLLNILTYYSYFCLMHHWLTHHSVVKTQWWRESHVFLVTPRYEPQRLGSAPENNFPGIGDAMQITFFRYTQAPEQYQSGAGTYHRMLSIQY